MNGNGSSPAESQAVGHVIALATAALSINSACATAISQCPALARTRPLLLAVRCRRRRIVCVPPPTRAPPRKDGFRHLANAPHAGSHRLPHERENGSNKGATKNFAHAKINEVRHPQKSNAPRGNAAGRDAAANCALLWPLAYAAPLASPLLKRGTAAAGACSGTAYDAPPRARPCGCCNRSRSRSRPPAAAASSSAFCRCWLRKRWKNCCRENKIVRRQ